MKRRSFLKKAGLTAIAGGTAVVAAPVVANTQPSVRWRLTSSFPKSLPILYAASTNMAEYVRQATNGQFQIDVYPPGEIVPAFQVFDAVSKGVVQAGATASYYYFGKNPAYCFDTALPFGLNTRQAFSWMIEGNGQKLLDELFAQANILSRPIGNTGAQMGGWFRKEVKTVADLHGLKMRTAGFTGEMLSALGVVPQQIPGGDIYPSLEKGTLDAVEWIGPYDDEKQGFYKVAKYYYYPGFWEGSGQFSAYFNLEAFHQLPESYQTILQDACWRSAMNSIAAYDGKNPDAMRRLLAQGAVLRDFSTEIMDAAYDASQKIVEKYSNADPMFKKIADDYFSYRDSLISWFNIIETTYTRYLAQKIRQTRK
ncbi:TRAP transporter substrate-binding protein [Basilea psittacipulmonis]|uniref:ABC transporter substrate-binding protein n=1 Tax=Basilea psittacipulmonis DSM 24701 TaxID=1072685 RepID=A0A077DHF7_9BURK|nr:TRAP transporter substrate-binding protein DctP [Basilea psittacipulmonis]AIL32972.1 ABC transporter substrate-binding protein [Basilea psittacipulmonis DSM 24701]